MSNKGYFYLATPYSKRPPQEAYDEALQSLTLFMEAGISAYSPIVQTHPCVAETRAAERRPLITHQEWLDLDFPLVARSCGVVVVEYTGWDDSKGVAMEVAYARKLGLPVIYMTPGIVPWSCKSTGHDEAIDVVQCDTSARKDAPAGTTSRKGIPLCTGVLDYFPDALAAIARVSKAGNDKHNPGQPLHWSRDKSTDHADCIARHLSDRGKIDPEDGELHEAHLAWRALALLQLAEEKRKKG